MDYIFFIKLAGFVMALVIFSVRIERRLTRIEVDIGWIKGLMLRMNGNINCDRKEQET